jgi:hypothetical protein
VVSLGELVAQHILPYFIKNVLIYGTLWVSSSIHYNTLEGEIECSSSGGTHIKPTRDYPNIKGKFGYSTI